MGVTVSWFAARSRSPEELLEILALSRTGEEEALPESAICGTSLATGWYVIVVNDPGALRSSDAATLLSTGRDVVELNVNETMKYASAAGYRDGNPTWLVVHDARQGVLHLETHGTPPIEFSGVRAWHEHDQRAKGGADSDVDCIFEIPVDLGKRVVGYRHDEELSGLKRAHWDVLARTPEPARDPVPEPEPEPEPKPIAGFPLLVSDVHTPSKPTRPRLRDPPRPPRAEQRPQTALEPERKSWRRRRYKEMKSRSFLERLGNGFLKLLDALGQTQDADAAELDARRKRLLEASRRRRKQRSLTREEDK